MQKVEFAEVMSTERSVTQKRADRDDLDRLKARRFATAMVECGMNQTNAYIKAFPELTVRDDGKKKAHRTVVQQASVYAKQPMVREEVREMVYEIYDDLKDPKNGVVQLLLKAVHANVLDLLDDKGKVKSVEELRKLPIEVQKCIEVVDINTVESYKGGELDEVKTQVRVRNIDKLQAIHHLTKLLQWLQSEDESRGISISDLIADHQLQQREALRMQHELEAIEGDFEVTNT